MRPVLALALIVPLLLAAAPARERMTPEVWHPKLQGFDPPGEISAEFGAGLTAAGYEKLKKALTWEAGKRRTDDYFDGFDGQQFLLKNGQLPVKVRVKHKAKGPVWQVSRFVSKDRVLVEGLSIKIHRTENWEGKLKGPEAEAFLAATDVFFSKLDAGGAPLRAAGNGVNTAFQALRTRPKGLPGLALIDYSLAKRPHQFLPTKRTPDKIRLEALLPGFDAAEITLQLGREAERDPAGRAVMAYELEAEADKLLSAAQNQHAATLIGKLMRKAGIVPADLDAPGTRAWQYTTKQLLKP